MKKQLKFLLLILLISFFIPPISLVSASAHAGGTDENGGHYDHSTGEYHYHHGYSAHDHPNGVCPYDEDYSPKEDDSGCNSTYGFLGIATIAGVIAFIYYKYKENH